MPRILSKPKSLTIPGAVGPRQTTLLSFFSSPTPKPKQKMSDDGSEVSDEINRKNTNKLNGKDASKMGKRKEDDQRNISETSSISDKKRVKVDSSDPHDLEPENTNAVRDRFKEIWNSFKIIDKDMGLSWFAALESNFSEVSFAKLDEFVIASRSRGLVYPPAENVWEWTKQYPIQDVKVVILGQDPYHGPNQAHGLCFSVKKGVALPPSLQNMYKELEQENIAFTRPNHGCLTGWSEQGVLLLNAVLTVDAHKPNSHKDKGWENITDAVIRWISQNLNSVVFLLWGSYAQKKATIVDKKKHHLLQCPHPSPFSANKGFFGCNHFAKCNELLEKSGRKPIDWGYLP